MCVCLWICTTVKSVWPRLLDIQSPSRIGNNNGPVLGCIDVRCRQSLPWIAQWIFLHQLVHKRQDMVSAAIAVYWYFPHPNHVCWGSFSHCLFFPDQVPIGSIFLPKFEKIQLMKLKTHLFQSHFKPHFVCTNILPFSVLQMLLFLLFHFDL